VPVIVFWCSVFTPELLKDGREDSDIIFLDFLDDFLESFLDLLLETFGSALKSSFSTEDSSEILSGSLSTSESSSVFLVLLFLSSFLSFHILYLNISSCRMSLSARTLEIVSHNKLQK
jgi:hypothetical protein